MAVNIKLKRSAQSGKIPTTSSLELGEIALNTFDGRAFMKIQNNVTTSVVEFATTAGSGSSVVSASYALTASFASYAANAGNALTANFATSASYALNSTSASYAQTSSYAGNFNVSGNLVVGGAITAQTLHVQTITSSIIYSSGSNIFGDSTADTQTLNGTVSVSGSFNVTGSATINNLTGSLYGTASWALNAISSSYANNATTASYALNATSASYANNATSASYANNATSASYAANATTASYALDATSASYASNATTASYALNSTSASYASASTSASYAANATTASYALNSELLDGLDSTVFTLTSSFNTFTQSYYTDSASFNNRINSLTESVFTHVVTNSGASNYIIDGVTKPILSFVPGATYRFNTNGVVGTHPFKFSTSPNGPTEYTTGVTSGSGYIQIEVNYDTPTTLYYYCTIHSGMGNAINVLRINTLNTGSFSGSFIGTFTGSFSGSLNNLQGTATYIPFFSSSQVLANSAMYQVNTASIAINETNITTANPEALYVFQTHPTSINVVTGKGNLNNYLQNNIQNTNQGVSASSDVVATANNGSETSFYIDMGINSENYNQGFVGAANDAYLYSAANHLHIGNITPNQPIQFFAGGPDSDANRKFQLNSNNLHQMTGSLDISGSLTVRDGITGSLFGTASWALNAISSSYTNNATSASYASGSTSASYALNATTASYALNSTSASYALNATSASYASASTSASYAINAVTASYALDATSASYALNATSASYASASTSASYALNATTASYALNATSASYAANATTASYSLNTTSASYAFNATSASYAVTAAYASNVPATASYAISASHADTASYVNPLSQSVQITGSLGVTGSVTVNGNITTTGTITAQTLYVQTITSSVDFVTGSTHFGTQITDTHQFTGSVTVSGSLAVNGSNVILANQTSSMSVLSSSYALTASYSNTSTSASYALTASYVENAQTASFVLNAISASYASGSTSASYAANSTSASYASGSTSASYALNATSASYSNNSVSASYALNATSASYASGSISASYALNATTASYAANATSASYAANATSASYASGSTSASYAANATSASYAVNSTSASYSLVATSASYSNNSTSASYALTASFALNGGGGGLSALYIQDEGSTQGTASYIDFTGAGVTATVTNGTASIVIPGGGGGSAVQGASVTFSQPTASTTWSINHAINSRTPVVEVYDSNYNVIIPTGIYNPAVFQTQIYFDIAQSGYAIISTGGVLSVSGSNAILNQATASTTWSFNHELNNLYPVFTIFDSNNDVIIPQRINVVSTSSAVIYFSSPRTGTAVASIAGNQTFASSSLSASYAATASYVVNAQTASFVTLAQTASFVTLAQTASFVQNAQTASFVTTAQTASFVANAQTASYVLNAVSASYANNATTAATASFVTLAQTASFVTTAQTASFVQNAQTASFVTLAQTASFVQNAQTASYVLNAISASYANNATTADTASFVTLAQTASFVTLAQTASFVTTAQTASFVQNAQTASYVLNAVSASYAASASNAVIASTASSADSFLVRGTLTAQTLVVQTVTSSVVYSSGSNIFGNDLSNTQILTGSVTVTGSLAVNGSNVILTNQTSSMSVATASFVANAQTASYVLNAVSASYANNATNADTASFVTLAQTASFVTTAQTASFVTLAQTASFVATAQTASYVLNAVSSSYASSSTSASYASNATSASYSSNSTSASYALTASFALNGGGGGISAIYIADEGTLQGTASYFDFTGAGVTATVSAGTASINITGGGGGGTSGLSTFFTQSVAAVTWSFTHNLNTRTPLVQVYDTSYNQVNPQYISASNGSTVEIGFGIATAGFAVASTGGTLYVTGSNVILDQSVAAATWSFNHNLNTQYPIFQVFNSSNEVMIPERIVAVDTASALIYFPTTVTGKAVASLGGLSGSFTASYALNANTASYALTSSYSLSGTGFPYSGSAVITGSFLVSQSFVDFTKASYVTGSFTGSFLGTASYATQALTASYATFALTASTAPGYTVQFSQSSAATTWSFTHNMNTRNPIVQVYDTNYKQIIPNDIVGTGVNTAEIRFDYAQAGYAVMSNGGGLYVTGSTSELIQSSGATTWSFTHNLNSKYVNFTVYDSNDFVIIPANIKAIDVNSAELYFATSQTGRAVAQFSGINGAPNATTASYALTASYASTFAIDQSLMDYASVNSSIVGSNNLFTQATGSYTSAFIQYTCASGSNSRAGRIMAVWNGGTIEFNDVSTADIGSTTAVTSSLSLVGTDVQFNVQTNTSGWRIKSTATFM